MVITKVWCRAVPLSCVIVMAIAIPTLKQHYDEVVKQLNNPVVVARLLVLEGVFAEPDLDTVERKRSFQSERCVL